MEERSTKIIKAENFLKIFSVSSTKLLEELECFSDTKDLFFKVNKSRCIALFVVSVSIEKLL